jgi:hypothetical protein
LPKERLNAFADKGTPQSMTDAQIFLNASGRINRRLFGKNNTDSTLITPGMESSIDLEMTGDLILLESHEDGIAKYKEAALMEYKEMVSQNMNFALLYRKIALQSLDLNGEKMSIPGGSVDTFDTHLPRTCFSIAWTTIRKGDDLLLMTHYEQSVGQYMKAYSRTLNYSSLSEQVKLESIIWSVGLLFMTLLYCCGFLVKTLGGLEGLKKALTCNFLETLVLEACSKSIETTTSVQTTGNEVQDKVSDVSNETNEEENIMDKIVMWESEEYFSGVGRSFEKLGESLM